MDDAYRHLFGIGDYRFGTPLPQLPRRERTYSSDDADVLILIAAAPAVVVVVAVVVVAAGGGRRRGCPRRIGRMTAAGGVLLSAGYYGSGNGTRRATGH
jgi:hypothetical protein